MNDLFIKATRKEWRFPSTRGDLTVEQLWHLPLVGKNGGIGFDLNTVAIRLNAIVKELGKESFVETNNPQKDEAEAKLELVKFVIATIQAEAKEAEKRAERAEECRQIMAVLAERDRQEMSQAFRDELLVRLNTPDD